MSHSEDRQDVQFSPAARAALTELVKDISDEISWRATTIANRGAEGPTLVSVLDVTSALEQHSANDRKTRSQLRVMVLSSVFFGAVGLIALIAQTIIDGRDSGPFTLIAAATMGAASPGLTFLLMGILWGGHWKLGRRSQAATAAEVYDFMRLWISLESTIRANYSESFGESRASLPVMSMLSEMQKRGVIDSNILLKLNEMREMRNVIAHGKSTAMTRGRLMELSRDGHSILAHLTNGSIPSE